MYGMLLFLRISGKRGIYECQEIIVITMCSVYMFISFIAIRLDLHVLFVMLYMVLNYHHVLDRSACSTMESETSSTWK